jgi:hypothetical protein
MVETFATLIGRWPQDTNGAGRKLSSIRTFANDLGIAYSKAQVMKFRSSVGVDYWPALIEAARCRGIILTHEDLARMRDRRVRNGGSSVSSTAAAA